MFAGGHDLADRLVSIHERLDHPPGVVLGVLRLPILGPILDELEGLDFGAGGEALTPEVRAELELLAELLTRNMLGAAPEALQPRLRIVEILRRAEGGRIPIVAADSQDPFGLELRGMLETDDDLRVDLGRLHPLLARATSVSPSASWRREAAAMASSPDGPRLAEATRRVLAALLRAPISSRPDLLIGGVRPANQRLARGLVWFAAMAFPLPAELLGAIGLRMGTSGRSDAVVRDVALASTCASLLGETADRSAAAALASMRGHVTNRIVRKQVDRALQEIASRSGTTVEEVIDLALPTFGLDEEARLGIDIGAAHAAVTIDGSAAVIVRWQLADGSETSVVPASLAEAEPAAVADVAARVVAIEAALADERTSLEARLGSTRSWPAHLWQTRFIEHPVAGSLGRRLLWVLHEQGRDPVGVLPATDGWLAVDGALMPQPTHAAGVQLWHPAEAGPAAVAAWRAALASHHVRQPIPQVDREIFLAEGNGISPAADLRLAGRIVNHARLRALLRAVGWAAPALGPWDQGDEATAWRVFDDGLRAELRYHAVDRVPTGDRVERARIVALRFVRTSAPAASPAADGISVPLCDVPPRTFSEATRDVRIATVAAEHPPEGAKPD